MHCFMRCKQTGPSNSQMRLDVRARCAAHALHPTGVAVGLLVVQVAPEQELHLLGRQRQVRRALKQPARALPVPLADLLWTRTTRVVALALTNKVL